MGADFIFAITKVCTNPDQAKQNINDLPFPALAEIAEALWGDYPEPEDDQVLRDVRNVLSNAIDIVHDPDRRDISLLDIEDPGQYALSGGMSWGDSPTESFDPILALQISGLEYE